MSKTLDSIRVAIRVRPLLKRENGCKVNWQVEENTVCQLNDGKRVPNGAFTFDRIFDKDMSTVDVYMDFARPIVLSAMEGINGTLFAYGQTSSGKTYTMTGNENSPGIIPYALREIFDYISRTENQEFLLRVSYMEIYNEVITDLLKPKHTNLKIHENAQRVVFVGDLTEKLVTSDEEIIDLMKIGESNRHFGCTNMNEKSSRSHTIFKMVIESRETSRHSMGGAEVDGAVKVSHLNLVDLAGSERASVTGAEGIRLREGGFINKSLFALGNVINKLSEGESTFVPFRDSKLTRILQTSLGGNAKTSIICAVTPASNDETLSTLQFASRAKTIKNRPEVNEVLDETTLLKCYKREINKLKKQLEQFASKESMMELQMEKDKMEQLLHEQRQDADKQREKLRELANFFCTAEPKESGKQPKRNKRRWTVCPLGALSKPPLHLDLPSSFNHGLISSHKRRKANRNSSSSSSADSLKSPGFNQNSLDRFFADVDEKEEEVEEMSDNENIPRRSGSLVLTIGPPQDKRRSFAKNIAEERIAELELEVKRLTEERNAIRNDLSDNITSSCEIQEDLLNTKQMLKEKKQHNRELQERLKQLETSRDSFSDKENDGKQILELKESLSKEREMLAVTEATFNDMCLAKENVEKELSQTNEKYDKMVKKLQKLDEENIQLRLQIEELSVTEVRQNSGSVSEELKQRVQDLANENASLNQHIRDMKENYCALQEDLAGNCALLLDVKPSTAESSKSFKDIVNEKDVEILNLKEKNEQLAEKLAKRRRRASYHSTEHFRAFSEQTDLHLQSNMNLISLLNELEKVALQEKEGECRELQNVISQVKNNLIRLEDEAKWKGDGGQSVESEDSHIIEGLKVRNSQLVNELEDLKRELDGKCSILEDLKAKIDKMTGLLASDHGERNQNSEMKKKIEALEEELRESSESNKRLEEKLNELAAASERLKEGYQDKVDTLRKDFNEELERQKGDMAQKSFRIEELEVKLKEAMTAKQLSYCEQSDSVQFEVTSGKVMEMAAELEKKSETVDKLQEQLQEALSSRDMLVREHEVFIASLHNKTNKEFEEKDPILAEKYRAVEEIHKQLQQALSRNETLVKDHQSHIARLQHEFKAVLEETTSLEEKSKAFDELQEKWQRTLSSKEALMVDHENGEDSVGGLTGTLVGEIENQIIGLNQKVSSLDDLEDQFKQASVKCRTSTDSQDEFSPETEMRDVELGEKSNLIEEPRIQLQQPMSPIEDAKSEKAKTKKIVKFKEHLQEEAFSEEVSLKDDKEHILNLQNGFSNAQERKGTELEANVFVDELKELALSATDQHESPLKHRGNHDLGVDPNEVTKELERKSKQLEQTLRENAELPEQLDHALCDEQVSWQKHEEHIANLLRSFDKELEKVNKELQIKSNEINRLSKQLEQELMSKEGAVFERDMAGDPKGLEKELKRKNTKLDETSETVYQLEKQLMETLSSKDQLQNTHEDLVLRNCSLEEKFREELDRKNVELNNQISTAAVLREELQQTISSKEALSNDFKNDIARLQKTFEEELAKRKSEIEENESRSKNLDEKLRQEISSKQAMVRNHEIYVDGLKKEFGEELQRIHSVAEEKSNLIRELEKQLEDAIAGNDLLQENTNQSTGLRKKLDKELQVKSDVITEKSSLIATDMEAQVEHLMTAKKELVHHHETYIASLKKEFNEEFERMSSKLEDEIKKAKSDQDILLSDHEAHVTELKGEFRKELERLNAIVEQKSIQVLELEAKINDKEIKYKESILGNEELRRKMEAFELEVETITVDVTQKRSLISGLESELMKTSETKEALAEERASLLSKCQSFEKELSKIRLDFETQCGELLALKKRANDSDRTIHVLTQENGCKLDDLSQKNECLKQECERLEEQVQELLRKKHEVAEKDARIAQLTKNVEQLTKNIEQLTKEPVSASLGQKSCENCQGKSNERKSRESILFKSMLEDIKEQVSTGKGEMNQNNLIDELNHLLVRTQEKLEQKEFVIDEKEIEISEKDTMIQELEDELRKSQELAVGQETKFAEWHAKLEQQGEETADWKAKLEQAEVALEKAKEESKEITTQLRFERETLQRKLVEFESILSEEQPKEFHNTTLEEKNKRITELERELEDTSKKDHKICELELELEVLQSELSTWKSSSEEAQISLEEFKDIIKKQEEHIIELEASKSSAAVNDDENTTMKLQDLRQELEAANSRLEDFENEKNKGLKILREKNQLLDECEQEIGMLKEDLDEKSEELKEISAKLQEALQETKEKEAQSIEAAAELKTTKSELKDIHKAHQKISNELDHAIKQLSDQDQSVLIEKLRKELSEAKEVYHNELQDRFKMQKTISELEGKCEELKKKIEVLEDEKPRSNAVAEKEESELEMERAVWKAKEQEMVKMKEEIEFLTGYVDVRDEDYKELKKVIQEMEDEIDDFKNRVENLESEKKSLEELLVAKQAESASFKQQSQETSVLKSQIETLEVEVTRLRSSSKVDLEEELKKVRNALKSKDLDLYQAEYEKTKQLDSAKSKIRELQKDCASYARKNNELKTEIRRLRSQDDEPTVEIMNNRQPSSRSGDSVGVIGSVALFTLDAKVAKLQEENEKLKQNSDTLQQKNDTLNIINLDLKQKYGEISEKYKRLKEQFVKGVETVRSKDQPELREQRQTEIAEQSRRQDCQYLFSSQTRATSLAKESQGVKKMKKKPIVPKENKENLLNQEKPDACKTQ